MEAISEFRICGYLDDRHTIDTGSGRSLVQPLVQLLDGILRTDSNHLNFTTREVLRIAGDAASQSLLSGTCAKKHALHFSRNHKLPRHEHVYQPF